MKNQTLDYYGRPMDAGYADVLALLAKALGPKIRPAKPRRGALLLAKALLPIAKPIKRTLKPKAKPAPSTARLLQFISEAVASGRMSGHDALAAQAQLTR